MWAEANISNHKEEEEGLGIPCRRSSASRPLRKARLGCEPEWEKKEEGTRQADSTPHAPHEIIQGQGVRPARPGLARPK